MALLPDVLWPIRHELFAFQQPAEGVAIRKVFGARSVRRHKQLYSRYAAFNLTAIVVGLTHCHLSGRTFGSKPFLQDRAVVGSVHRAGVCIFLAGLLSVSYYLARVAYSNPVRFLRRE